MDDDEHDFQLASAARHNSAVIDGWYGGQLEVLVGGLHNLAHRAGGDRPALLDERPRAQGYWAQAMRPAAQNALIPWALKAPLEFRAVMDDTTPASAYRALNFPVLILRGERTLMPAGLIAEGLLDLLPTSRLIVIDGAGHMGPLTHTAEVCAAIMRHIAAAHERCAAITLASPDSRRPAAKFARVRSEQATETDKTANRRHAVGIAT